MASEFKPTLFRPWSLLKAQVVNFLWSTLTARLVYQVVYGSQDEVLLKKDWLIFRREWHYYLRRNPVTNEFRVLWLNPKRSEAYKEAQEAIEIIRIRSAERGVSG